MSEEQSNPLQGFDLSQQRAILGWILKDAAFARQCLQSLQPNWFFNTYAKLAMKAIIDLHRQYLRIPTEQEVLTYRPILQEEARVRDGVKKELEDCSKATEHYRLDRLRSEMDDFIRAARFAQCAKKAMTAYNNAKTTKEQGETWKVFEAGLAECAASSFSLGSNSGLLDSEARLVGEAEERRQEATQRLGYGIKYLDDALKGIGRRELIVIGAKSGIGKSSIARDIAIHNAQKGYPVHFYALEAEDREVERRMKYSIISDYYYQTRQKGNDRSVSFTDWYHCEADDVLGPIEDKLADQIKDQLKNLKTFYRTSEAFDVAALEKNLLISAQEARLIVVDHLHYIDVEEDENRGYKTAIKRIRDIGLRYNIPIIVVAHLRKSMGGKDQPLIAGLEEFHGTSDVPKTATTCIILAKAFDQPAPPASFWLQPTYIQIAKNRLEGNLTNFTAISYFNTRINKYEPSYLIGRLVANFRRWDICDGKFKPYWAKPDEEMMKALSAGDEEEKDEKPPMVVFKD